MLAGQCLIKSFPQLAQFILYNSSLRKSKRFFLKGFTLEETHKYLEKHEITDKKRIEEIHHFSRGLSFYLELLTYDSQGEIDLIEMTVSRLLRWIPQQEEIERQLAFKASLFNGAFKQEDLITLNLPLSDLRGLYK